MAQGKNTAGEGDRVSDKPVGVKVGDTALNHQAAGILSSPEGKVAVAPAGDVPATGKIEIAPVATQPAALKALDASKPVADLVRSGAIVDNTNITPQHRLESMPAIDKSVPRINVELQDLEKPPKQQPHFVVREDGSIEMNGDPEKLNSKDIKIQIERKDGQLNPTEAQTQAADNLVKYLSDRIQATNPNAKDGIEINDDADVIDPATEAAAKLKPAKDLEHVTPETKQAIEETNRFRGSNGVDMPRAATDNMGSFGTRRGDPLDGETIRTMGIKEATAGLFKPDKDNAYETVRKHPDGGYRVGRYGFSGNQLSNFLESLGDPLTEEMIDKLVASGKLSKSFGAKLKNPEFLAKLKGMAKNMQEGGQPSKEDMKNLLPTDVQESIASNMIDQLKGKLGDKPGEISAAMMTGKPPSEVSKEDLLTPEGQQMTTAGQKLFDIATARQNTEKQVAGSIPVEDRDALVRTALEKAGADVTQANINAVKLIVQHESSWNPNAVNDWDSNARKGTPSKGLMQTIGPTFNAHAIPGHKNILDPLDNMIAGIRYSEKRYGSLLNVPGVKSIRNNGAYKPY